MNENPLLAVRPVVINIGIPDFAESLRAQEVKVVHVEWMPLPELDADVAELLEKLL